MYKKVTVLTLIFLTLSFTILYSVFGQAKAQSLSTLTLSLDKNRYCVGEQVKISGTLSSGSGPISNGLVAMEVTTPFGSSVIFKTIPTGNITSLSKRLEITQVVPCDSVGKNRKNAFYIQPSPYHSYAYFNISVRNNEAQRLTAFVTITVYDGSMMPIASLSTESEYAPGNNPSWVAVVGLPYYAVSGVSKAVANAFTASPKEGGIPYCLEKSTSFLITRNTEFSNIETPFPPETPLVGSNGTYSALFKLSPEPRNGTYGAYAVAREADSTVPSSQKIVKAFTVDPTAKLDSSYPPAPPQASFTFNPLHPYKKAPVTFDASASSAEGYGDVIVKYEWTWNDGTAKSVTTNPTITHAFANNQTYIVTLNVTDSEGLWSTTTKPVKVYPPDPPIADFKLGNIPVVNKPAILDASISKPGYNGTHQFPIVSYRWNFGDGNITTVTVAKITHVFTAIQDYTVTLEVTDSSGLKGSKSQIVEVFASEPSCDINGDGICDLRDVLIAIGLYLTTPSSPKWNPKADIDKNNIVDLRDILMVISKFATRY